MPRAEVDGRQIYYEIHPAAKPADRCPLVLIAGLNGSYRGWLPLQVPDFARERDVVLYDHRGVGQSEDDGTPFSTRDLAADACGLLDALEIPQADFLGAFMGGMVAQELAIGFAGRVRRLVLVGTYARADSKRRMLLADWTALVRAGVPMDAMIRQRLLWTLQDETLEQTDLIEAMVEFYEKEGTPTSPDVFTRQCDACLMHDAADELRLIPHTTLVVCGRQDHLTPLKFHRELADEIPEAHLVTMSYGGHLVMAESAERFNQIVLQFLDD